jgi:hypothetical protein|tara:strand:+ start:4930 stop:6750 length:1821 start_codon:yes stop_codon:yes gene_type:complete
MAENKFLSASRIKTGEMISDIRTYVSRIYGNAGTLFTTASPFSQVLDVLSQISKLIFFYIEDATVEQNILTAQNPESIYGLARLAGHDSFRGAAASGEIEIRLNTMGTDDIAGDALNIPANATIKSNDNSLVYTLRTNNDQFRLEKSNSGFITIPVVQGEFESQTVTSTGESFQSFNIITKGITDHSLVRVTVNSSLWSKYDSLYDMKRGTQGYMVKTGITGGLDIYFGNGSFGEIPQNGASIVVEYLKNQGAMGNLNGKIDLTFKFETEGTDSLGNTHDLNELLESKFTVTPMMGANPEQIELTKLIAPLQSHSFVLATPDNYEHFLSRYGMFSYLDAYNTTDDGYLDDDNVIYLFMLPDTKKKLQNNKDYFSLDPSEFLFTEIEKEGILGLLEKSGRQMVTTEVKIVDPVAQYFRMDIKVRYFEGYHKANLFTEIRSRVAEYLINITRRDRLPKSDIIAIIESIEGIDSVNIRFVSEKEETARKNGYYISKTVTVSPMTPVLEEISNGKQKMVYFKRTVTEKQVKFQEGAPLPENVINLDSFGDILLEKEEIALIRGGWEDKFGLIVDDSVKLGEKAAMSVYFDEPAVRNTIFAKIQAKNRKQY